MAAAEEGGGPEALFTADELITFAGRTHAAVQDAVLAETQRGYDMLFVGLGFQPPSTGDGSAADGAVFNHETDAIIRGCGCPVAVARSGSGAEDNHATEQALDILLPIIGTDYSLAGAEIAVAMAKGCGARLTAMHISRPFVDSDLLRRPEELYAAGRNVFKDMEALGRREGVDITVRVRVSPDYEAAILRQIDRGRHNLVVLGTKTRLGEHLSFGQGVGVLLQNIPCSVVLIAF